MQISLFSLKNTTRSDKPNEDLAYFDQDSNFLILLDGVSRDTENGYYPTPSPTVDVVKIICEVVVHCIRTELAHADNISTLLRSAILKANNRVKEYNEFYRLDFCAGAVGIFAMLYNNVFHYAYIGDCYGRSILDKQIKIFTTQQTALIAAHKKEYSAREIRNIICNNPKHPYSYGVLNGDPRAEHFLEFGAIPTSSFDQIILSSDGPEEYLSKCSSSVLKKSSAKELITQFAQSNDIKQDDRTIIKLVL